MARFSIPYNNDPHILETLFREFPNKKENIGEIFFSINNKFMPSGRILSQEQDYEEQIILLTKQAYQENVKTNMLLNPACFNQHLSDKLYVAEIINYLTGFRQKAHIDAITISDFILAKQIKKEIPDLMIECSCVAYVESIPKIRYWVDIGCEILVIPPDYNKCKDLQLFKDIKKSFSNLQLKLIVNETCLPMCPMRRSHYNIQSHGDDGDVYRNDCESLLIEKPWLLYSSAYIPPQYLSIYEKYIDIFKLIDRRNPTQKIMNAFGCYSGDERYQSKRDEWNQRIPEPVFQKIISCDKNCISCDFCFKFFNEQMKTNNSIIDYFKKLRESVQTFK